MVNLGNTDLNQRQGLIFTDSVLKGVMKCIFSSLYCVSENWLMKLEKETFNIKKHKKGKSYFTAVALFLNCFRG